MCKQYRTQFHILLAHQSSSLPQNEYFRVKYIFIIWPLFRSPRYRAPKPLESRHFWGKRGNTDLFADISATNSLILIKIV
jgi:hypothetical protein